MFNWLTLRGRWTAEVAGLQFLLVRLVLQCEILLRGIQLTELIGASHMTVRVRLLLLLLLLSDLLVLTWARLKDEGDRPKEQYGEDAGQEGADGGDQEAPVFALFQAFLVGGRQYVRLVCGLCVRKNAGEAEYVNGRNGEGLVKFWNIDKRAILKFEMFPYNVGLFQRKINFLALSLTRK